MKIAIIIVAWNSGDELRECIGSLVADPRAERAEVDDVSIIVVDNGSTDGSIEGITGQFSGEFSLISLRENVGFARASNIGMGTVLWDYVYFLNPDTIFSRQSVLLLCAELEREGRRHVGIVGPALSDAQGVVTRSCSRFPTLRGIVAGVTKIQSVFGLPPAMLEWNHHEMREVDQVIGAALMIRGELLRKLGGFDEQFFVYYEEVDLCLRAQRAGYACLYCPSIQGVHRGGGSTNKIKIRRLFYVWRSRMLFGKKHFTKLSLGGLIAFNVLVEPPIRLLRSLLLTRLNDFGALFYVWWKMVAWIVRSRMGRIESENRTCLP
jgi:N-acetylglucosaminyl-diphospho-decaprenol L-rhamnosyltransferase